MMVKRLDSSMGADDPRQFNNNDFKKTEVTITAGQDDEHLPIQCVCGHGEMAWDFFISIYEDDPTPCPACGREYFFRGRGVDVFSKI